MPRVTAAPMDFKSHVQEEETKQEETNLVDETV
jgi:hypothetical protein